MIQSGFVLLDWYDCSIHFNVVHIATIVIVEKQYCQWLYPVILLSKLVRSENIQTKKTDSYLHASFTYDVQ